jgi:hypothetical protein
MKLNEDVTLTYDEHPQLKFMPEKRNNLNSQTHLSFKDLRVCNMVLPPHFQGMQQLAPKLCDLFCITWTVTVLHTVKE